MLQMWLNWGFEYFFARCLLPNTLYHNFTPPWISVFRKIIISTLLSWYSNSMLLYLYLAMSTHNPWLS